MKIRLPQPQKQGGRFRAAARIFLRALPLLLVYRKCCDLMGLPVTFSGKPILHKHVSSGENSRVVCSRGFNRAPRFTVQVFVSAGLIFLSLKKRGKKKRVQFDLGRL